MRLRRLDLTRYGRFTGRVLDFGAGGEGNDLHIVYGPNEAGKSTIFNAFLDLLYGIPVQSPYGFLHPYSTMRIGAALEVGGATREVVRIKRPTNSLVDVAGQPLPEALIAAALGGIGRDAYRSMFSLDDDSLESGGRAILESKGDLGPILFSATAGLADLSRRLGEVRGKADAFYKKNAHGGELIDLKQRLAKLRDEHKSTDVNAGRYASLVKDRDEAHRRYEETLQAKGVVQVRVDSLGLQLGALPRLAALRDQRVRLAPLLDLPEPPSGWADDLPGLMIEEIEVAATIRALEQEIGRAVATLDGLVQDGAALAGEHRLAELDLLHPRKETAIQDLPARRQRLADEDEKVAGALARMGLPRDADPSAVILPVATTAALNDAIAARSGVETALDAAEEAVRDAEERLEGARARCDEALTIVSAVGRPGQAIVDDLTTVLAACRRDDHRPRARTASLTLAKAEAALRGKMSVLTPFRGTVDELSALAVPEPKTVSAWGAAVTLHEADLRVRDDEVGRLEGEIAGLAAERDSLAASSVGYSDEEAAAVRSRRDHAWSAHRSAMDQTSADRFEAALRHDDDVGARRLGEVSQRARLDQADATLAGLRARRQADDVDRNRIRDRLLIVGAEVAQAWHATVGAEAGPAPRIGDVEGWIERRVEALTAAAAVDEASRASTDAAGDGAILIERLRRALEGAGGNADTDDLDLLFGRAQAIVDAAATGNALRAALREREADLGKRRVALLAAERGEKEWTRNWNEACASCWLGLDGSAPSVSVVKGVLKELTILAPSWDRRVELADRIGKMERDVSGFFEEAQAIAKLIGDPATDVPGAELAGRVRARIAAAVAVRDKRDEVGLQLEGKREVHGKLLRRRDVVASRIGEMAGRFGVGGAVEVAEKLAQVASRAQLLDEVARTEREIVDASGTASMAEAEKLLEAADREGLLRERSEAKPRLDDLDQRCRELFATYSVAADAVADMGSDAAAAILEERRRTTLLEIEDGARRYLKLRAGIAAMEQALRMYRDLHRGSMMERASETFSIMSRGAYVGLRTQPHKDREVLIAAAADGGSKEANDLSKGTRFQLYLALRAAGYLEFARSGSPPPFVADDIMETFDDFRAEEALRLFANMTGVGQVIYMTHHRHLIPIARDVCPGVRVHDLGSSVQEAA